MAAAPTPDPGSQPAPPSPGADQTQGGGAPSGAPASPELMQLAAIHQHLQQMAQSNSVASAGLAKATQGITEAMSALASSTPQQGPSASPPY